MIQSINSDSLNINIGPSYSVLEQNCINDMKTILALLQQIDPSHPDPGLLKELCVLIHNELGPDCAALANSPLKADQDMAGYINDFILQLPFGQSTLQSAADAFFETGSLTQMNSIFAAMVNSGSYQSFVGVINDLIQNPFNPPS